MKTATIMVIDIKGSDRKMQSESPAESADYWSKYYHFVFDSISVLGWRFVKCIGDSILITAEVNDTQANIKNLYKRILSNYDITLQYRLCSFIEKEFKFGNYSCLDVIGKDINNLFMGDTSTKKMG